MVKINIKGTGFEFELTWQCPKEFAEHLDS